MATSGSRLFRYDDPLSARPTSISPSGQGELVPVVLRYAAPLHFAKGGLAAKAASVKGAGRMGDDQLVHVNSDELAQMKEMWGEPTVNPETGQPEFFLGGFFKKLLKVASIAANFVPGIGPVASTVIGAANGAVNGGSLKSALGGALSGAASGGLGGSGTLGNQLASVGGSVMQGQDPLSALAPVAAGVAANAASTASASKSAGTAAASPIAASANKASNLSAKAPSTGTLFGGSPSSASERLAAISGPGIAVNTPRLGAAPQAVDLNNPIAGSTPGIGASTADAARLKGNTDALFAQAANILPGDQPGQPGYPSGPKDPLAAKKPGFLSKDFLGIKGLPTWAGIGLTGLALSELLKKKDDGSGGLDPSMNADQIVGAKLQPTFGKSLPGPSGFYNNLSARSGSGIVQSEQQAYGGRPEQRFFNYAKGGRTSFAVEGPGSGRSDDIPAMLSDGEYVIDADTVAMLGNGSSKAGADALDKFRVNIRKHKGRNMARGRMSAKSKKPEHYLSGGRV